LFTFYKSQFLIYVQKVFQVCGIAHRTATSHVTIRPEKYRKYRKKIASVFSILKHYMHI